MKKILFMVINMNIGGTEKALLNMISEIPKDKYEVTILMLEKYGGFLESIPKYVNVKYLDEYSKIKPILNDPPITTIKRLIKKGSIIKAFNISIVHYISKVTDDRSIFFRYILKDYPKLSEDYDLAVAYAGPMDFISYYVLNRINANKKVQWIHFDVTKIGFNKGFASINYKKFNKIFIVSEKGKNKLINLIPSLESKVEVFYNIISKKLIIGMAEEKDGFNDNFNGTRILTVGRLSEEKGQDLTISALSKLKAEGYNIRWYSIGQGPLISTYKSLVETYKLQNEYIFLGAKINPYPFMRQCDIYVQPSRHEGYCITLAEARCFNNPIITTNFTGASEQIIDEKNGLIVNRKADDIYAAIKRILIEKELKDKIKVNLSNEVIENTHEIDKIYSLID